jgi:hypothetical protein
MLHQGSLRRFLDLWQERSNAYHARNLSLNYQGSDVGLRSVHGPAGMLVQSNNITQMYSGKGRVSTSLPGEVTIEGIIGSINSSIIQLNPEGPQNYFLMGKNLNPGIFLGDQKIVTAPKDNTLDGLFFVTNTTRVMQDGSIVGAVPFNSVLQTQELYISIDDVVDENMEQAVICAKFLGVDLL